MPDDFGWTRGATDSTHHEWDDFSTAVVGAQNEPDIASFPEGFGGEVVPYVAVLTGGGFITSTSNIYSFSSTLEWEVVVPTFETPGGTVQVILQTRTLGNILDQSSVLANGLEPVEREELLFEQIVEGFGGVIQDYLWRFELPATSQVTITFEAAGSSASLDRLSVDTLALVGDSCPADVNGDGSLTDSDFFAWVTVFVADPRTPEQETACDVNLDGTCTDSDFFAWVTAFVGEGCP
ncbi:MAG: GC-type dockerin domain-anchored protein [Planctomycetota bacterium]